MIGDPDPYTATINALELFRVDDVVISTLPNERSGWLRANLIERVRGVTSARVEHVVVDIESEGLPFRVTLVVAARTLGGEELLENLRAKAAHGDTRTPSPTPTQRFSTL